MKFCRNFLFLVHVSLWFNQVCRREVWELKIIAQAPMYTHVLHYSVMGIHTSSGDPTVHSPRWDGKWSHILSNTTSKYLQNKTKKWSCHSCGLSELGSKLLQGSHQYSLWAYQMLGGLLANIGMMKDFPVSTVEEMVLLGSMKTMLVDWVRIEQVKCLKGGFSLPEHSPLTDDFVRWEKSLWLGGKILLDPMDQIVPKSSTLCSHFLAEYM